MFLTKNLGVGGLLSLCGQLPKQMLQQATTTAAWLPQNTLAGLCHGLAGVLLRLTFELITSGQGEACMHSLPRGAAQGAPHSCMYLLCDVVKTRLAAVYLQSVCSCANTLRSGQASCVYTPRRGPNPAGVHTAAGSCYAWSGFVSASAASTLVTELLLCSVVQ